MTARGPARCGTPSGRQAHRRRGQDPCEACVEADRVYHRAHYRKAKPTPTDDGPRLLNEKARSPSGCPHCDRCRHYAVWTDRVVWACGHVHHFTHDAGAHGSAPDQPNPVSPCGSRTT